MSDSSYYNLQNIVRPVDFPANIKLIPITGPPLSRVLNSDANHFNQCPHQQQCVCDNHGVCLKKNTVYQVKCNTCQKSYIGETHRTFLKRTKEHLTDRESALKKHFLEYHDIEHPDTSNVSTKIIKTGFKNTLERKEYEK